MKKLKYIIVALALIVIAACGNGNKPQEKRPDDIIPKAKMIDLMVDMYIIESANNMRMMDRDTLKPSYGDFFATTMEKYDVTLDEFERSLQYYSEKPEDINEIYDETLERLSKMESEAGVVRDPDEEF